MTKSVWQAWNSLKHLIVPSSKSKHLAGLHHNDSIWWPAVEFQNVDPSDMNTALKLHHKGFKSWGNLWNREQNCWHHPDVFLSKISLSWEEIRLLTKRMDLWDPSECWKVGVLSSPHKFRFQWTTQKALLPIPSVKKSPPIHLKLNGKWNCNLDRRQWYTLFEGLWSDHVDTKKSVLGWLIMHRAIWTAQKALRIGKGDGKCASCQGLETDTHLFMHCGTSKLIFEIMDLIMQRWRNSRLTWQQFLLGESVGCTQEFWTCIRVSVLWAIWCERNRVLFGKSSSEIHLLRGVVLTAGHKCIQGKTDRLAAIIEKKRNQGTDYSHEAAVMETVRQKDVELLRCISDTIGPLRRCMS